MGEKSFSLGPIMLDHLGEDDFDVEEMLKDLAFSLHLNIAASAIKLNKFNDAITSCSLILDSNKRNVKALFSIREVGVFG